MSSVRRLQERAARILAVRDHSEQELRRKLNTPVRIPGQVEEPVAAGDVEQVIGWCREHNWLDDERYTARFIQSRSQKGYGSQRIRQELQQRGIARHALDNAFAAGDIVWIALARTIAERKFGSPLPGTFAEKVKVQRFLLYRGFLMEDIQDIWRNFAD